MKKEEREKEIDCRRKKEGSVAEKEGKEKPFSSFLKMAYVASRQELNKKTSANSKYCIIGKVSFFNNWRGSYEFT